MTVVDQGRYRDLANLAQSLAVPVPTSATPGPALRDRIQACLAFEPEPAQPQVEVIEEGVHDGVRVCTLRWQLPYGPPTEAFLCTPAAGDGPWPGILALHDHGGYRWLGKEKVADGPRGFDPVLAANPHARRAYSRRPAANDLARRGFCVLAHDVFTWGSRRFTVEELGETAWNTLALPVPGQTPSHQEVVGYNVSANEREHTVVKWCTLWGTTFPGILAYEDRTAVDVLLAQPDCRGPTVGCFGCSGGAARAAFLVASDDRLGAAVSSCLHTTWAELAAHKTWIHTWQFLPPGLRLVCDWPDVIASRAPMPLYLSSGRDDQGFSAAGKAAAHERVGDHYAALGADDRLVSEIGDHGHAFPAEVQARAAAFFDRFLA